MILLRIFQEIDDLDEICLFFVRSCDIFKRDFFICTRIIEFCAIPTEAHRSAGSADRDTREDKEYESDKENRGKEARKKFENKIRELLIFDNDFCRVTRIGNSEISNLRTEWYEGCIDRLSGHRFSILDDDHGFIFCFYDISGDEDLTVKSPRIIRDYLCETHIFIYGRAIESETRKSRP